MAYITIYENFLGKKKKVFDVTTTLGTEVLRKVNNVSLNSREKFIESIKHNNTGFCVYRDHEDEFTIYNKFGVVYNWYNGRYYMITYPKPSKLPIDAIKALIQEEEGFNNYDRIAELYRFLSLTDEQKDLEGFAFYNYIWEEDEMLGVRGKCVSFGTDEEDKENLTIEELKDKLNKTYYGENKPKQASSPLGDLQALALLKAKMDGEI